ncbi:MAG TPA: GrpB family protein [Acidimicrobiia bacterium]
MTAARITISDYDPSWPRRAEAVIELVLAASGGTVERVEHIGSTAIPGMAARDVIDLQATVDDLDAAAAALDASLGALGFARRPYDHDHVPAGLLDDPERWIKRCFSRRDHPDGDVNLHLRLHGSPNERLALLFRDWFRAHPDSVPAYAAFKRSLAAEVNGIGAYADVKDPVVDLVETIAETWAAVTGWSP